MSQVLDVNLDVEEMQVQVENGKQAVRQTIPYDSIRKIRVQQGTVKKWYGSKTVKQLLVYTKTNDNPLIISSDRLKSSFDATEAYLRRLAERNGFDIEK